MASSAINEPPEAGPQRHRIAMDRTPDRRYCHAMTDRLALPSADVRSDPIALAAIIVAAVGIATILGAWVFQYGFGLAPCPLCLRQRDAYYVAIPLAALIALGVSVGASRKVLIAALIAIAAAMTWNAGLGVYHAGIEWKWWAGPSDCSGPIASFGSAGGLLKQMQTTSVVRCDEAPWRLDRKSTRLNSSHLGISYAVFCLKKKNTI